jgi:chitinase
MEYSFEMTTNRINLSRILNSNIISIMNFKRVFLRLFLFSALAGVSVAQAQKKAVLAYYAGGLQELDGYDPNNFTHIIYCFGHLNGDKLHIRSSRDTQMISKMVGMKKKNPDLKVLLSLGGWGGCRTCSEVFSTSAGRETFANSVKSLTDHFGSDGIDLDWEYPAIEGPPGHRFTPEDKGNFTQLVKRLREVLGLSQTITFAAGGFGKFLEEAIDWQSVMPYVDFVNLMTYDLINDYSKVTGHHTALYSTSFQKESTDSCVRWLLSHGVDPGKLIVGAAFYARIWKDVPPTSYGLNQSGNFQRTVGFSAFEKELSTASGFKHHWDSTAQAPYAYDPEHGRFATFDDKRSIEAKTRYVLKLGLGGIMFWHLGQDTRENGLVQTIVQTLRGK